MTSLLERPRSPTDAELEALVDDHTPRLLRSALALGFDPGTAEELVQDTFVAFLEARDRFEGRSAVSTYLVGILYNKARELWRARGKEPSLEGLEEKFEGRFDPDGHWSQRAMEDLSEPERLLHNREIESQLVQCLAGLTVVLRLAFTLKEVEGLETAAICASLAVSANHLGVLLFRARNQLRECLRSKNITSD